MPDIFLYPGEPNPNDVRLSDPTFLRSGAVSGTGAVAFAVVGVDGVGVATFTGSGSVVFSTTVDAAGLAALDFPQSKVYPSVSSSGSVPSRSTGEIGKPGPALPGFTRLRSTLPFFDAQAPLSNDITGDATATFSVTQPDAAGLAALDFPQSKVYPSVASSGAVPSRSIGEIGKPGPALPGFTRFRATLPFFDAQGVAVGSITGDATVVLGVTVPDAMGIETFSGAGSVAFAVTIPAVAAIEIFSGDATVTPAATLPAATGTETFTGSGSTVFAATIPAASGVEQFTGTGAVSHAVTTPSASGTETFAGTGSVAPAVVGVAASGLLVFTGAATVAPASTQPNGIGAEVFTGTGAVAFAATLPLGSDATLVTGASDLVFFPLQVQATGRVVTTALPGPGPAGPSAGGSGISSVGRRVAVGPRRPRRKSPRREAVRSVVVAPVRGHGTVVLEAYAVRGRGVMDDWIGAIRMQDEDDVLAGVL